MNHYYVPNVIMTRYGPSRVKQTEFLPTGHHPSSPIRNELNAIKITTDYGYRWWSCEYAYINSELRIVVIRDANPIDWKIVPDGKKLFHKGLNK